MPPADQDVIEIGDLRIRYLIDGVTTGAASGMFELTVPPGARVPPPHSHSDNEEIIYCLEGALRCSVDGVVCDIHAGEEGYSPRGAVHSFSNPFDRPARALVINTPDIGAQYFRDVAAVVGASGGPDPARIAAVMARYGLKIAAPKPAGG